MRLPAAADELATPPDPQMGESLMATQTELLRAMREIMANVRQWEDFGEAVQLLEELIAEQQQVHGETLDALEHQLDELLRSTAPEESSPPGQESP